MVTLSKGKRMKELLLRLIAFTIFQLIRLRNWIEPPEHQYRILSGYRRVAAAQEILKADDINLDPACNARSDYDLEGMKQQILEAGRLKPIKVKKRKKR